MSSAPSPVYFEGSWDLENVIMAFIPRNRHRQRALGAANSGSADATAARAKAIVQTLRGTTGPAVEVALALVEDPALQPFVTRIRVLKKMEMEAAAKTPGGAPAKGVGLDAFIKPLDFYIYTQRHRWAIPASIAIILGVPFALGYFTGRRTRR